MDHDDLKDRVGSFAAEFCNSSRMEMSDDIGRLIQDLWKEVTRQRIQVDDEKPPSLDWRMDQYRLGELSEGGARHLFDALSDEIKSLRKRLTSWIEADKKKRLQASVIDAPRPVTFDEAWRDLGRAAHDIKDAKNREELTMAVNLMKQCIQAWDDMNGD